MWHVVDKVHRKVTNQNSSLILPKKIKNQTKKYYTEKKNKKRGKGKEKKGEEGGRREPKLSPPPARLGFGAYERGR